MSEIKKRFKKIGFIFDETLIYHCDKLPTMLQRASIVQDLINSYGLLKTDNVLVVKSVQATEDNLKEFHSSSYIDLLKQTNDCDDTERFEQDLTEYGLTYDCPLLPNCYDFISSIAGSTLTAATLLCHGICDTVINWFGGWHHAQRDKAEGFCYVNDIVLGIQRLQKKYKKVLYIDLDVHHGDGVQNAFEYSNNILTLSFHKKSPGFYPGSGSLDEIGQQKGLYHSINVPFLDGISDMNYLKLFDNIFPKVLNCFNPSVIVVQCGGDILSGDRVGQCNISIDAMGKCIKQILNNKTPTLLLGGGGYNIPTTARYWTYLTSIVLQKEIDTDIPDNSEYFMLYGPTYELHNECGNQKDHNSTEYIQEVIETVHMYCNHISK